ncbi:hypothetical protein [Streptomyces roseochromogenus]|uniref:HTH tetR-type domain-containing protein n=1 Tax=Streptomyces roseochromogenus subsp. oscitans DS 12.976 TaxID=1352936 RepID=V6KZ51_STRRC|nr:hypothetical protein [Streptomyces roseochromogenus]EST34254.1 hypothetical protein M878_10890 [Streptomyces roseochromogenus subsp. oscitans DS 12.976]
MGMSKGAFHHHFGSMPKCWTRLLDRFEAKCTTAVIDGVEASGTLQARERLYLMLVGAEHLMPLLPKSELRGMYKLLMLLLDRPAF